MNNSLNVIVTGKDEKGRELVSAIVSKSLSEHGFTNVTTVNAVGEPTPTPNMESVFDAVQAANPGLFAEPVRIWTNSGAAETESTDNVGALNGVPVDDTPFVSDAIEADVATEEPA